VEGGKEREGREGGTRERRKEGKEGGKEGRKGKRKIYLSVMGVPWVIMI
jgi:hypothetical protein